MVAIGCWTKNLFVSDSCPFRGSMFRVRFASFRGSMFRARFVPFRGSMFRVRLVPFRGKTFSCPIGAFSWTDVSRMPRRFYDFFWGVPAEPSGFPLYLWRRRHRLRLRRLRQRMPLQSLTRRSLLKPMLPLLINKVQETPVVIWPFRGRISALSRTEDIGAEGQRGSAQIREIRGQAVSCRIRVLSWIIISKDPHRFFRKKSGFVIFSAGNSPRIRLLGERIRGGSVVFPPAFSFSLSVSR